MKYKPLALIHVYIRYKEKPILVFKFKADDFYPLVNEFLFHTFYYSIKIEANISKYSNYGYFQRLRIKGTLKKKLFVRVNVLL